MAGGTANANFINGSAALDPYAYSGSTASQEAYTPPETEEESYRRRLDRERLSAHEAAIANARAKQSVSIGAVLWFGVIAVLMVYIILSYVSLTEVTAEISKINGAITELQSESKKLKVEYETTFNLNEVKEYATTSLGMRQLTESQITRFSMSREDKGVVLAEDDAAGLGIVSAAKEFISELTEYLR